MGKKTKTGKGRLDKYYHLAKEQGYRARSAFKLVQLAKKYDFLSKSKIALDLCAAPGSWAQVAQQNMPSGSLVIAVDLVPIKAIHGVVCMQADITTDRCRQLLKKEMKGEKADCVLHDGAPNVGTSWAKDAYVQNELTLHAMKLACEHLRPGGVFVTKVFRSQDYNSLLYVFKQLFAKVDATKPQSSRNVSAEIFVMCSGFKNQKIDPRFYDPKWVFMETTDPAAAALLDPKDRKNKDDDFKVKKQGASLKDHIKSAQKKHRGGYEEGDDNKIIAAHDFVEASLPANILIAHHKINLEADGSLAINANPLTTDEIRELCGDLKILGKRDLSTLMKWRMKLVREKEKREREALKAAVAAAKAGKAPKAIANTSANDGSASGTVGGVNAKEAKSAAQADVDDAIDRLLEGDDDEGGAVAVPKDKAAGQDGTMVAADSDSEVDSLDEDLDKELKTEIDKKRLRDKKDKKKTMERQKKREMKKKMNLSKPDKSQAEEELFKGGDTSLQALEDEDEYVTAKLSDPEESSNDAEANNEDSDDESMDRITRMELDMAISHEMKNSHSEEHFRKGMQRKRKQKKESRRETVTAAWAGELQAFNQSIDRQAAEENALENADYAEDDDDSDGDLAYLRQVQRGAIENSQGSYSGIDTSALEQSLNFNLPKEARPAAIKDESEDDECADENDDGDERPKPRKSLADAKSDTRMKRWFDQDIFNGVDDEEVGGGIMQYGEDSDKEDAEDDDVGWKEFDDSQLPKMPLTDKAKRKKERAKKDEWLKKTGRPGGSSKNDKDEDDDPLEVAEMEAPKPLVRPRKAKMDKPDDPRELAEIQALGSLLVDSKKSRMEVIDAAYNRWTFDDEGSDLPVWFTEEEHKFMKPELPVSKELMAQFRAKLREINARPIRKVTEAKNRKKKRLTQKIEKLRKTAMSLSDNPDMSDISKAKQIKKLMRKATHGDERKVTVVAMRKGGGGSSKDKKPPKGAKTKVVDRRLKNDRRAQKRTEKKNKGRDHKLKVKKFVKKQNKRRGKGGGKGGGGVSTKSTA